MAYKSCTNDWQCSCASLPRIPSWTSRPLKHVVLHGVLAAILCLNVCVFCDSDCTFATKEVGERRLQVLGTTLFKAAVVGQNWLWIWGIEI